MERWRYVDVSPNPADRRPRPPRADWVVRPTAQGRRAQEAWRPLIGVIEQRWQARFGEEEIGRLRELLAEFVSQLNPELPDYLPVLGYGLAANVAPREGHKPSGTDEGAAHLVTLVSKVLLAFTLEFERESDLSLAICANVIRLLSEEGVYVRDLPCLSGVSKEMIKVSVGFLAKRGYVVIAPDPAASGRKVVRLTPKGREAQCAYRNLLGVIEQRWQERFGKDKISRLRQSLEQMVGEPTPESSPLFRGLEPYPDGWRASVPKPQTLPHYPMVTHRGGFPDGS